ncbi:coiled-coil domain-containing protein 117 [Brachionichthys hirsutus]|uniref:coiled-coil domain-containing protein 117 n=1 Tax=Brachionichthys hirsutus TaxID=412623 RepID=UPI00360470F7
MHHAAPPSSEVGFLPAMYSFSGPTSLPEIDLGPPSTSGHSQRAKLSSNWETRSLRKNRRRVGDEACSAKRRRLMSKEEEGLSENPNASTLTDWSTGNALPAPSAQRAAPASPRPRPAPAQPPVSALSRPETESSCMEIEAAHRRLQEIEDRIILEDDEDEDLDVEPAQRRPVLVISDSLKEGLQRGIGDILPQTVAQCVSHSCMELVLWRPPDDPFCRRRKGPSQKQRKQVAGSERPRTPCASPGPSSPPADTHSCLYSSASAHNSGEEDMEI